VVIEEHNLDHDPFRNVKSEDKLDPSMVMSEANITGGKISQQTAQKK